MLAEERNRRLAELTEYIYEMAKNLFDTANIRKMAINLKTLYSNNFRHDYSIFFPLILEIAKDENPYSLDYLSNNLDFIRNYVENDYVSGGKEFKSIYHSLLKLSDHLNLEIARYSYYSTNEQKLSDLQKRIPTLQSELQTATHELSNAKDKISTMQTELIAVLSIFAAIILTFSGSLSFIGSSFSMIAETPLLKSTFFILLCGLILFNAIFLMLYVVGKITGRNIYAQCKSVDCSCDPRCSSLIRLKKRLPYIFWFDAIIILFLMLNTILLILDITI